VDKKPAESTSSNQGMAICFLVARGEAMIQSVQCVIGIWKLDSAQIHLVTGLIAQEIFFLPLRLDKYNIKKNK